ncbi:hypothetical protein [Spirosoma rhododendri]|uniref:Uncharacterized protein n=1 Tax=Spirosoma rhododendri TaxID=2728024 RepID=A0A7L5DRA6_9BACT|nr:hypothetical protein [Spirosoma rhododendri]QJD80132.1 hypothetical protein HH216_18230 [Spirosoma rhododendri]
MPARPAPHPPISRLDDVDARRVGPPVGHGQRATAGKAHLGIGAGVGGKDKPAPPVGDPLVASPVDALPVGGHQPGGLVGGAFGEELGAGLGLAGVEFDLGGVTLSVAQGGKGVLAVGGEGHGLDGLEGAVLAGGGDAGRGGGVGQHALPLVAHAATQDADVVAAGGQGASGLVGGGEGGREGTGGVSRADHRVAISVESAPNSPAEVVAESLRL